MVIFGEYYYYDGGKTISFCSLALFKGEKFFDATNPFFISLSLKYPFNAIKYKNRKKRKGWGGVINFVYLIQKY